MHQPLGGHLWFHTGDIDKSLAAWGPAPKGHALGVIMGICGRIMVVAVIVAMVVAVIMCVVMRTTGDACSGKSQQDRLEKK